MNLSSISRIDDLEDRCRHGNRNTWMVSCLAKCDEIWATCWQAQRAQPSQCRSALAFDDDHVQVLVVESDKKLFRHQP
jgi:hypothetical protein